MYERSVLVVEDEPFIRGWLQTNSRETVSKLRLPQLPQRQGKSLPILT